MTNKNGVSIEQATQVIVDKHKNDIEACQAEIQAVLDKYNCTFDFKMIISDQGTTSQVSLVKR